MKNGKLNEFLDQLYCGNELLFIYNDKKYFIQGWTEDHISTMTLTIISSGPFEKYLWEYSSSNMIDCAKQFLKASLWDGQDFLSIEDNVIWTDW